MRTTEVNDSIIGKRCKSIFTGLMVSGIIKEIKVNEHAAEVKVRFDEPHNWGGQWYKYDWSFARFHDEFGSLRYLEIIDDGYETVKVSFSQNIRDINRMFTDSYERLECVNLKERIDSYESSRFTQTGEQCAIITFEYNMEHIREWLTKNMPVTNIETII